MLRLHGIEPAVPSPLLSSIPSSQSFEL
jgi:hypothetical protein